VSVGHSGRGGPTSPAPLAPGGGGGAAAMVERKLIVREFLTSAVDGVDQTDGYGAVGSNGTPEAARFGLS